MGCIEWSLLTMSNSYVRILILRSWNDGVYNTFRVLSYLLLIRGNYLVITPDINTYTNGTQYFLPTLLSKCQSLRPKVRQWFGNTWFWGAVPDAAPKYSFSDSSLVWDTGVPISLSCWPAVTVVAVMPEAGLMFMAKFTVLTIFVSFKPNSPKDALLVTRTAIMVGVIPWNSSSKSTQLHHHDQTNNIDLHITLLASRSLQWTLYYEGQKI